MSGTGADRPLVLALLAGFWPGHDANGPSQSLIGLCSALARDFRFSIIARDRPFGSRGPGLARAGVWCERAYGQTLYCVGRERRVEGLASLLRRTPHDLLLLNSFFDPEMSLPALALRRLGLIPRRPVILAPRGELSPGALSLKSSRKRAYLALVRATGLLDGVTIQATSEREATEIGEMLPGRIPIVVAPNLRPPLPPAPPSAPSPDGILRLAYLSRIDRKKNLDFALSALAHASAQVRFDVWGPVTEETYAAACRAQAEALPPNIQVRFMGPAEHDRVHTLLGGYDALLLPTRGENFGHAIVDAFAAGCPAIISDQTPWIDLQTREAGWSLPLDRPVAFTAAIEALAAMDPAQRAALRVGARRLAEEIVSPGAAAEANRTMLLTALGRA